MYHVNPNTFEVSRCRAKKQCRFGDVEHHESKNDALRAVETAMEAIPAPATKTIVLSDIDGTLLRGSLVLNSAVDLHQSGAMDLGTAPERWLADRKNEAIIIELAEAYRFALQGRTVGVVKAREAVKNLLSDNTAAYETLQRLIDHRERGDRVVLISGSPDFIVGPFAKLLGFDYFASKYHRDRNQRFTGEITLMAGAAAKEKVIETLGLDGYDTVIGFGDTASDAPLLAAADYSVLVDPTPETIDVLRMKGIRIDEIVRPDDELQTV